METTAGHGPEICDAPSPDPAFLTEGQTGIPSRIIYLLKT